MINVPFESVFYQTHFDKPQVGIRMAEPTPSTNPNKSNSEPIRMVGFFVGGEFSFLMIFKNASYQLLVFLIRINLQPAIFKRINDHIEK